MGESKRSTHVRILFDARETLRSLSRVVGLDICETLSALVEIAQYDPHTRRQLERWARDRKEAAVKAPKAAL